MKKLILLLSCILSASGLLAQVSNNNEDEVYKVTNPRHASMDFVPGEVLVKMKDASPVAVRRVKGKFQATDNATLDAVLTEFGVSDMEQVLPGEKRRNNLRRAKAPNGGMIQECDLSQLYRLRMAQPDRARTMQLAQRLEEQGEVEFAEPNYKAYIMAEVDHGETIAPNPSQNPQYPLQWGIPAMKINELWTKPVVNGTRPVIAIIDTGVDTTHPDLAANCVAGYDFINETSEVRDNNGHGTHVAGIAAACDNGIGVIGANPRALIMPVAVLQSDGSGDVATLIRGIDYAAQNGATVINMSLGTYSNSKALRQALERAYQSVVLVAAAGNDALGIYPECGQLLYMPSFPAAYSFVLGVQATTNDGALAGFSNFDCDGPNFSAESDPYGDEGFNYELSAPGVSILSTVPNGGYKQYNGTSMAAPLVAGAISALRMVKEYDNQEVLWGDLLHTSDFLAAYNLSDRPAELEVLGLQFDDRQELVEGENHTESDGRIDAGETIKLYPVLRTVFGEASNIKLHLEVGEYEDATIVTIMQNDVDFGYNLSPYGKNVSENPLVFKTKGNVVDGRHIKLKLTATCDGTDNVMEHEFTIVVDNVTKIGGIISQDMTLVATKRYLATKSIIVSEGVTLTIEPGTQVDFIGATSLKVNGKLIAKGTPENPIILKGKDGEFWQGVIAKDTLKYVQIEYAYFAYGDYYFDNCVISNCMGSFPVHCTRCNIVDNQPDYYVRSGPYWLQFYAFEGKNNNIVNNRYGGAIYGEDYYDVWSAPHWASLDNNNYFNSYDRWGIYGESGLEHYMDVALAYHGDTGIETSNSPSYLGTSSIKIAKSKVYDLDTFFEGGPAVNGIVDLSNMLTEPVREAHGIVWKVCVNGKDAQDEFEEMLPLGMGRHKFEVYYNRPMNKAVVPNIAFGLREPYTQNAVNEDGAWNEDGTIYTAYVTITKRTQSDGINRIYVWGGEDNEYFECPYEKTRFNVNIQAAGSMSTGFMAEGGAGCVNLSWNKSGADGIEDAMGYNIYRYQERVRYEEVLDEFGNKIWDDETNDWMKREIIERDTLRINPYVLDTDQESYVDRAVNAGETYYYFYKLQGTNMKEYGLSNTVSAIPRSLDDLTVFVATEADSWHAGGMVGWAAQEVTTRDGRQTPLAETYEQTTESTGTVMEQTVTGLKNGTYQVTLYANAVYTPDRGFDSDVTEGQTDVVYVFANDTRQYIPVRIGETVEQHGEYTLTCTVTDGTLRLGMVAEKPGTNWHSIQIKSLDFIGFTGTYYLRNMASAMYLSAGNDWGTRASLNNAGLDMLLTRQDDGSYTIDTGIEFEGVGHYLGIDADVAWCDRPAETWTLTEVGDGYVTLYKDPYGYLAYDGTTSLGWTSDPNDFNAYWRLDTRDDRVKMIQDFYPTDATFLLPGANFGRNDRRNYEWQGDPVVGGDDWNLCAEKFNTTFDVWQEIEVPNGTYKVDVQGFYREGADEDYGVQSVINLHNNGGEHLYAQLYANEVSTPLKSIFAAAGQNGDEGVSTPWGCIPNNMAEASHYFSASLYDGNQLTSVRVTDGKLRLGIKKDVAVEKDWTIFDNFRLTYYGNSITGDVNLDGSVDVADIAYIISAMAGTDGASREQADVNADGSVDVADIASVIDIMAGK